MENWPVGYERRVLDQVDSTLDEARRIAPTLTAPTWILAHRQTSGRGRRGRAWVDPEGNFACALIFRPQCPRERIALYSFVASLALHEAFIACGVPSERLSLKWPNDLLLDDGKLAGILLESTTTGQEVPHLAIGIGANLLHVPNVEAIASNALPPVSVLQTLGLQIEADPLLSALAQCFARLDQVFVTFGFAPIRERWLSQAARIGTEIIARTMQQETRGVFDTIDDQGNLILVTDQGRAVITAADIFFKA